MPGSREEGQAKASLAIAADFRSRIAAGELREGQALPVESALVDELGVSKAAVREALRILETEGLTDGYFGPHRLLATGGIERGHHRRALLRPV